MLPRILLIFLPLVLLVIYNGYNPKPPKERTIDPEMQAMFEESVAEINKLHQEIELQIKLENEERANIYNRNR